MAEIHVSASDSMSLTESVSVAMSYKPAWSFGVKAVAWRDAALAEPGKPDGAGTDEGELTLIYSAIALESFIAEQIATRLVGPDAEALLSTKVSIQQRWTRATQKLAPATHAAQAACEEIRQLCLDAGDYGLLVRSRNKLVHPRMHTETLNDAGHSIDHAQISRLVDDLARLGLPRINPVFPHLITNCRFAEFSVNVLGRLISAFYRAVGQDVPESWRTLLE